MYRDFEPCNGKIDPIKCSACVIHSKVHLGLFDKILSVLNKKFYENNIVFDRKGFLFRYLNVPALIRKKQLDLEKIMNYVDRIIVISRWFEKVLLLNNFPKKKLVYIGQGVSSQSGIINNPKNDNKALLQFVYVGRITFIKGLKLLLEALSEIKDKKIILHIYGRSNEASYLTECQEIISKSIHEIIFKGVFKNQNAVSILSQYDALIQPSISSEMSALVIQEAFAAKIPVIASDIAGNSEHVIPKLNGFLFKKNDSDNLASVLRYVIYNPTELKGLKNTIEAPITFDDIMKKTLSVYHDILTHPN